MKKKLIFVFAIMIILILCTRNVTSAKYKGCEVHFIEAGQSDCTLIKTNSRNYLIDTGQAYYTEKILLYLNFNGVKKLDGIILTHYHNDHYEGLIKIVKSMKVSMVYLPDTSNKMRYVLSKSLSKLKTPVVYIKRGWSIKYPKIYLRAIAPVHRNVITKNSNSDENNNSIVLQGKIGGINYLFAGDCEKREENDILQSGELKKCDILKVPHHGINTSTGNEFLDIAKPKAAIITSNGKTPNAKVIKRLLQNKVIVLRTDDQGDVVIRGSNIFCDKSNIKINLK